MTRPRTHARELALQFLFQADLLGEKAQPLDEFLDHHARGVSSSVRRYAHTLSCGVQERSADIDAVLADTTEHWTIDRMATVDRNVLRLGVWELLHQDDVPPKVAINEAVDLAKKFSNEKAGAFVNGLLDKIKDRTNRAVE